MGGLISDAFTAISSIPTMLQAFFSSFKGIQNGIVAAKTFSTSMLSFLKLGSIFASIITIGRCIFQFFDFSIAAIRWFFESFMVWMFINPWPSGIFNLQKKDIYEESCFVGWSLRSMYVIFIRITHLQQCFMWYILDLVGWTLYLPFRFIFWLIDYFLKLGIVKAEHKAWEFINDIDYYIHGPVNNYFLEQYVPVYRPKPDPKRLFTPAHPKFEKFTYNDTNNSRISLDVMKDASKNNPKVKPDGDSLNLGFHIIHFPDAIMYRCYNANFYKLARFPPFPKGPFDAFMKCAKQPF
jgi:hypothetical protein